MHNYTIDTKKNRDLISKKIRKPYLQFPVEASGAAVRAAFVGLVADNVLGRKPWIVGGRQEAQIVATGEQRIGIRGHRR